MICADILTPLPAMGVDFTIIPGKGPKIINTIKTADDVAALKPMHDVALQVPFLGPILQVRLIHFACCTPTTTTMIITTTTLYSTSIVNKFHTILTTNSRLGRRLMARRPLLGLLAHHGLLWRIQWKEVIRSSVLT